MSEEPVRYGTMIAARAELAEHIAGVVLLHTLAMYRRNETFFYQSQVDQILADLGSDLVTTLGLAEPDLPPAERGEVGPTPPAEPVPGPGADPSSTRAETPGPPGDQASPTAEADGGGLERGTSPPKELLERVARLQKEIGYNQQRLADLFGVSRPTISTLLAGGGVCDRTVSKVEAALDRVGA